MKDCKYRLPCNWCDKHDRMCDEVLFEIHKQERETKCEHDWELRASEATDYVNGNGKRFYNKKYVCRKCGEEEDRFATND